MMSDIFEESEGGFLAGALSWLETRLRKPLIETSEGREFFDYEHYKEIEEAIIVSIGLRDTNGHTLKFGTCESLVEFLNSSEVREKWPARYRIVIKKDGITAFLDTVSDALIVREVTQMMDYTQVPFILQSAKMLFSYDGFKDFLDIYTGKVDAEEVIREFMRNPSVIRKESVEIKDKGAFTEVSFGSTKGIEGATLSLPKIVTVELPTGTREFETSQKFLFRVRVDNFSFELIKIENDGSWEELLGQIIPFLKDKLPNDLILEGA